MTPRYDLIVVGEGIAGLTCAAAAAAAGLRVASFEAAHFGGLVVNVAELDGFDEADGLSGLDVASQLAAGNRKAGVHRVADAVLAIQATAEGFEVSTQAAMHSARGVVIATGARLRPLNVPGESTYEGRGVSHCADCDAPLFAGAHVVVAGDGDWALRDALLLAAECAEVHVVHAGANLAARESILARARAQPNIHCHPNAQIEAVLGDALAMTGVRICHDQGPSTELPATGLFALVGLTPNSECAPASVARDPSGALVVNDTLETTVAGLWAIGQVRSRFEGWLTDAVDDARRVAAQAAARLKG